MSLHKKNPVTGEIEDITEDEDKAEAIRKLVAELSDGTEPEEAKKLEDYSLPIWPIPLQQATRNRRKRKRWTKKPRKLWTPAGLMRKTPQNPAPLPKA